MIHELWIESSGQTFCLAGPNGDAARALLEPGASRVWTVDADNHFEAMTKYYEYMDWGVYKSDFPEIDMLSYSLRDDVLHPNDRQ
jgi:hypothetical protein